MSTFWFFLLQLVPVLALIYYYVHQKYSYWSKRGIHGPKPFPFLGNFREMMKRGQIVTEMEWFKKYGKVYGTYSMLEPVLAIADPELVKQVVIKDFNLFVNRRKAPTVDEVGKRNLFNLEGDDWKHVRTITSPTFSTGKLRGMNRLMNHCVDKLVNYFENISTKSDGIIDTKKVVTGFTIDIIASTSFATETNANGDRSEENAFVTNGLNVFRFNPLRLIIGFLFPDWARKIINYFFPSKQFHFFRDLAKQVIKQRRETNARRNDFVQLLMDASVSEKELQNVNYDQLTADADSNEGDGEEKSKHTLKGDKSLSDIDIIAQCIIFFLAGFETTASAISHAIFEMAQNQSTQNRLLSELHKALDGLDAESDEYYDTVMGKIPYLDAVIKETLRLYPPLPRLERRVNIDGYKLAGVTLKKDQLVNICAYAIHHNPEYYPEPDTFNPDRFMPENKHNLVPYTYMPFGQGPRNCVGMRFAYQEIKLCLAKIIIKYQFSPTQDTPVRLQFANIGLLSVKPFPLKITKRK